MAVYLRNEFTLSLLKEEFWVVTDLTLVLIYYSFCHPHGGTAFKTPGAAKLGILAWSDRFWLNIKFKVKSYDK